LIVDELAMSLFASTFRGLGFGLHQSATCRSLTTEPENVEAPQLPNSELSQLLTSAFEKAHYKHKMQLQQRRRVVY